MNYRLYIGIGFLCGLLSIALSRCTPAPHDVTAADEALMIYPDYRDVTVPCNIAPLNFLLRGDVDAVHLEIREATRRQPGEEPQEVLTVTRRGSKMIFDEADWRELMYRHVGDSLRLTLTARRASDAHWVQYPPFTWYISGDSIDPYLTYRLIEPGYEVWDNVCIEERCLENFERRTLADGRDLGNRCMNCHTHGGDRGQYSFFYIRGDKGGTIVNRDGRLRKVTLKNDRMGGSSVYGDWHPSGHYAVYSTNKIIPAFHSQGHRRLEVFDTKSDICVADFERDSMIVSPLVTNTLASLETFPAFSADGRWIFFCTAENPYDSIPSAYDLRDRVDSLQYSLCRIAFDAETGTFGSQVDTIYNARLQGGSANFPKCSPDGSWLCFTRSDYGTFPIWHAEATLCLIAMDEIQQPEIGEVHVLDTHEHGTYHSWSHNSRWLAFASKRGDGQYGRVHFMHIPSQPHNLTTSQPHNLTTSQPHNLITLPQSDPEMDDWNLRSYNLPDLSAVATPYGPSEVKVLLEDTSAPAFK